MKLIQIFAREEEKYAQFEKKSEDLYKANWREVMTFAIFRPSIYLVSVLAMMLVITCPDSIRQQTREHAPKRNEKD